MFEGKMHQFYRNASPPLLPLDLDRVPSSPLLVLLDNLLNMGCEISDVLQEAGISIRASLLRSNDAPPWGLPIVLWAGLCG